MASVCPACEGDACEPAFASLDRDHSLAGFDYVRCQACGTVFIDPPPAQETLNAHYRAGDFTTLGPERYASAADKYLEPARYARDHEQYMAPLLRHKSGGALLDFACGSGWFTHHAAKAGFDALGIDIDAENIAAAGQTFEGRFRPGGLEWLQNAEDQSLDVIAVLAALEHLGDPAAFLQEVRRTVRSGGVLLVAVPTADSLQFQLLGQHYYWAMAPYHLAIYSDAGVRRLLSRCGFHVAESVGIVKNWYWTKAIADKLGLAKEYVDWRKSSDFVRFDIEIDALFDRIASNLDAQSARLYVGIAGDQG